MQSGDTFNPSSFTGQINPPSDLVVVVYDGKAHVYDEPEPTNLARYRFCIAISNDFGAHYDFVPAWESDRVFNADGWPSDCYNDDFNDSILLDPALNQNFTDSSCDTN